MVGDRISKSFRIKSIKIGLKSISQPGLISFYKLCSKKIWAEVLGTHSDSTVQKYIWVRHWLNQWPS